MTTYNTTIDKTTSGDHVLGVVLAGGKSKRFGEDKALLPWGGTSMLATACELLSSIGLPVVVATAQERAYPNIRYPLLFDRHADRGPLGGMLSAMSVYPGSDLLIIPCDMPLLQPFSLLMLAQEGRKSRTPVVYERSKDSVFVFPLYLPAGNGPRLEQLLSLGPAKVRDFLATLPHVQAIRAPDDLISWHNLNTQDDYRAALAEYRKLAIA